MGGSGHYISPLADLGLRSALNSSYTAATDLPNDSAIRYLRIGTPASAAVIPRPHR
jgi:hypothetical protein